MGLGKINLTNNMGTIIVKLGANAFGRNKQRWIYRTSKQG